MQTKPKANSVITHELLDNGAILFKVRDAGEVEFNPANAHANNRKHAELHGWIQRISDAAAISRDPETGLPATPQDKLARMRALVEYYESGSEEWSRVGSGGGGKSLTIEAIARVQGVDYETAEARVQKFAETGKDSKGVAFKGDTKKALAFLRQGSRVAAAMEAIRKERAPAPKVDADDALAELANE